MAIGIFTLRQQLRGLLSKNWPGAKTPYVEYLVVGGGGGGGYFGAGGAGGLVTGLLPVTAGTSYTVTVGGGGAGTTGNTDNAAQGISSSLGSITGNGGGAGFLNYTALASKNSGGSGAGGGYSNVPPGESIFGNGIAGQGNAGGKGTGTFNSGGGGGGAGTVGLNVVSSAGSSGGAGIASAISGTVTVYAGGGGSGGGTASGSGGAGGGGAGGNGSGTATGTAGQANTGGGGGGAANTSSTGGAGGSGIVIVSYPDIYPALTTGGATSPTVSTSGSGSLSYSGSSPLYLGYGAQTPFSFGTGDFTIEFWAYFNNFTNSPILVDWRAGAANTTAPVIYADNGTIRYFTNSADRITSSSVTTSTWHHIVVCRTGTSTKMYINGTQAGSTYTDSTNYTVSTNGPSIGNPGGNSINGYMSNIRIVKGNCVYTGNFTSPTAPLTATQAAGTNISAITGTQTSLLLNTVSGSPLADSSTNSYAATVTGTTIAWNQLSPFATGLGYKNRVYTWAPTVSAGSSATGTFTV